MNLNDQLTGDVIIDDLEGVEAATAVAGKNAAHHLGQLARRSAAPKSSSPASSTA